MPEIDLSQAQFDTPHPAGGTVIDLNSAQFDSSSGGQDKLNSFEKAFAPQNFLPKATAAIISPLTNFAGNVYDRDKSLFTQNFPNASAAIGRTRDVDMAAIQQGKNAIGNFIDNHPAAQAIMNGPVVKALEDTAKVVSAIPIAAAEGAAIKGGVELASSPVLSIADQMNQSKKIKQLQTIQEERTAALKAESSGNYGLSNAQNIQMSPDDIGNLKSSLSSLAPKTDMERRVWENSAASKHSNDILSSLQVEDPSFNGLLAKRTELNAKIKVADRAGDSNESRLLGQVKDSLDNVMMNENTGNWQKANHQWAQQATLDDLDSMVSKAVGRNQPANSLNTEINNYLRKNGKYLSDEEYMKLKSVAEDSSTDKLKRGVASGLTRFVAAGAASTLGPLGVPAGFLVGHYGSEIAKDGLMLSKMKKLDEFRDMIVARPSPEVITKEVPQTLMLTDRGNAARTADAQASALQRLKEGRTGGQSVTKPQTGPMVGRPDGDVPYNYYSPASPQRALTYQPLVSSEMKQVIGGNWDKLDEAAQQKIQSDLNAAYKEKKIPLMTLIIKARQSANDLAAATGRPTGSIAEAMKNARKASK